MVFFQNAVSGPHTKDSQSAQQSNALQNVQQLDALQIGSLPFQSVLNYFSRQVRHTPHATALVGLSASFTYKQLDQKANQLANFLQQEGVAGGDLVGVQLQRSPDAIIAFLAVLKAGAAYVPIDPSYPQARRSYILHDSQAKILLTDDDTLSNDAISNHGVDDEAAFSRHQVVLLSAQREVIAQCETTAPSVDIGPDDIAYVIYTSGTTGNPKGVMVRHEGVVNHAVAMARAFEMTPADRTLQFSSISFDVVVEELYPTLISGAALVLRPDFIATSLTDFIQFTSEQAITVLNLPAAFWHELVIGLAQSPSKLALPKSIRLVVTGSEKVSRAIYAQWYGMVGEYPRWLNAYGPTETTVSATLYDPVREGFDLSRELPIGRAIENVKTYVFNEGCNGRLEPVKPGESGELFIGGPGLARGYLNKPEKTAAAFVPHPNQANQRLYRTGDIVRELPDGNLEFLGRADFQVKIRGFRIELGEIANCLEKHPQVQQQIITVREDEARSEKQLVAYVVPSTKTSQPSTSPVNSQIEQQSNKLNSETLKAFLLQQLPSYAVPSAFVFLEKLPTTANGKVDRKALPAPTIETADYTAPTTEIEETLTDIWATVLSIKKVGVNDNFFELGGSSLKAIRLFSLVEQKFGQKLPLTSLLQAPTPAQLARTLTKTSNHTALWESLVPLQTNGTKPPLFFLHAVGPSILNYKNLLPYFDEEQVVYALQTKGLDEKQPLLERMEQMATEYIEEIKKVQPNGPYYLVGHSFGGLMAFEMAQQLHNRGEKVGLLGLFDSSTPALSYCQTPPAMYQIYIHIQNVLSAESLSEKWAYFAVRAVPILKKLAGKVLGKFGAHTATVEPPLPEIYRRIEEVDRAALRRYSPQVYPGKMTLFRAEEKDPKQFYDEYLGWQYLIEGELEIHNVPGHHMSLMFEPNVGKLARALQDCLNKAYVENEAYAQPTEQLSQPSRVNR